jgi:hypothetical protein
MRKTVQSAQAQTDCAECAGTDRQCRVRRHRQTVQSAQAQTDSAEINHSPCIALCSPVLWMWSVWATLFVSPPIILFGGPSSDTWEVNDELAGTCGHCVALLRALLSQPLKSQSWRCRSIPEEHLLAAGHHWHCNKNRTKSCQQRSPIAPVSSWQVGTSNWPGSLWTWWGNCHSHAGQRTLAEHAEQSLSSSWCPGDWSSHDDIHKWSSYGQLRQTNAKNYEMLNFVTINLIFN